MQASGNIAPFIKFAAICSVLGAITTTLLVFAPWPTAADFEAQVLLHQNAQYLTKLWILFFHPQFNLIASLGMGYLLLKKYPLRIILGSLFLLLWAYTEMAQQALLIDGLNQFWRPAYLAAQSDGQKALFTTLIEGSKGVSDSQYFLVIYGFGLGSLLYGLALFAEHGLAKWIGAALVFIGLLSVSAFASYYLGASLLSPAVNWCYQWLYPYLQPLVRLAIGVWLWQQLQARQNG